MSRVSFCLKNFIDRLLYHSLGSDVLFSWMKWELVLYIDFSLLWIDRHICITKINRVDPFFYFREHPLHFLIGFSMQCSWLLISYVLGMEPYLNFTLFSLTLPLTLYSIALLLYCFLNSLYSLSLKSHISILLNKTTALISIRFEWSSRCFAPKSMTTKFTTH
jgi:hypothetical protein